MNIASMLQQAKVVKERLENAQNDLKNTEITADSGNGAVTVVFDGQCKFKSIKIAKSAINPENPDSVDDETIEMIEDLVTTALKKCSDEATKRMNDKMKGIIPPGINIPGLF